MIWIAPLGVLAASAMLIALGAILAPKHHLLALTLSAVVLLALPWLAGPVPLVRALFALNFMAVFRMIDLVRCREPWSARRRVAHALSFVDTRLLRRERPRFDFPGFTAALMWACLAALALHAVRSLALPRSVHPLWLRYGGGLVFTYATIEASYRIIRAAHRAVGFETPRLHDWPLASLTVTEFWGMRWARPVSHWLRATCFAPLARRGHPAFGMLLCFVVSAIGHAYPVLVALGPAMTAMMFGYFVVQGVVVSAEKFLGVGKWPRALRRASTLTIMLATSPLFVEPCLRVVLSDESSSCEWQRRCLPVRDDWPAVGGASRAMDKSITEVVATTEVTSQGSP